MKRKSSPVKPPRLRKGDVIGLISPASTPSSSEKIEGAVSYFERLGYRVTVGRHAMDQVGYLAGTDDDRAADLNAMLEDKSVKAVMAIRGGYGTPRILDRVNYAALRRDPKIIVGYSDLTALLLAVFRKAGLVTFSGPMAGVEIWKSLDPYTEEHFWRVITSTSKIGDLKNPDDEPLRGSGKGNASGPLLGGNLSLLISLIGTPYSPAYRDSILFLEDVDEAPHRVDRMFAQLRHAGIFRHAKALVLGRFTDCKPTDPSKPFLSIEQVLAEVEASALIPVLSNFQYGHIPRKLTIPIGIRAVVDGVRRTLEVTESAVR
ncbi:MAG: LD-carboxypeptidase [Bacteroidota bacterium]